MIRADAFSNARAILERVPGERFGAHDKWATIDALAAAVTEASDEHERYKREIGLED
jgi:hypothetical protein